MSDSKEAFSSRHGASSVFRYECDRYADYLLNCFGQPLFLQILANANLTDRP